MQDYELILGNRAEKNAIYDDSALFYNIHKVLGLENGMEFYEKVLYKKEYKTGVLAAINYIKLDKLILDNYLDMSFEQFITKYSLSRIEDLVYIRTKLLRVCFNENQFTSVEDRILIWMYYYLGKWAHYGVYNVLSTKNYVLKPIEYYYERLDYLGLSYFKKVAKQIDLPVPLPKTGVPSYIHPKHRYSYTKTEKKIAEAMAEYDFAYNFLPWKDIEEIKYVVTKNDLQFEWFDAELSLTNNAAVVEQYLLTEGHAYYSILCTAKEIDTYDPSWSAYKDKLLKKDRKAYAEITDPNAKMFPSFPDISDLECKTRLDVLGKKLRWNKVDIEKLIVHAKLPPTALYEIFDGFRSERAIDFAYSTLEKVLNKRLPVLLDEKEGRVSVNKVISVLKATGQSDDYIKQFQKCF